MIGPVSLCFAYCNTGSLKMVEKFDIFSLLSGGNGLALPIKGIHRAQLALHRADGDFRIQKPGLRGILLMIGIGALEFALALVGKLLRL